MKWHDMGEPRTQGVIQVQEQTARNETVTRFKINRGEGENLCVDTDELFDLAEILADLCDEIEGEL